MCLFEAEESRDNKQSWVTSKCIYWFWLLSASGQVQNIILSYYHLIKPMSNAVFVSNQFAYLHIQHVQLLREWFSSQLLNALLCWFCVNATQYNVAADRECMQRKTAVRGSWKPKQRAQIDQAEGAVESYNFYFTLFYPFLVYRCWIWSAWYQILWFNQNIQRWSMERSLLPMTSHTSTQRLSPCGCHTSPSLPPPRWQRSRVQTLPAALSLHVPLRSLKSPHPTANQPPAPKRPNQ